MIHTEHVQHLQTHLYHFFFLRQAVERNNSLNDTNYHKRLFQISHRLQSEEVRLKEKGNFSLSLKRNKNWVERMKREGKNITVNRNSVSSSVFCPQIKKNLLLSLLWTHKTYSFSKCTNVVFFAFGYFKSWMFIYTHLISKSIFRIRSLFDFFFILLHIDLIVASYL